MLFFCSKFLVLCHVTTFCYNITVEVMGETYETITTHSSKDVLVGGISRLIMMLQ